MSRFGDIRLDAAIVRRLIRGERKAQEIVYRAYANPVYTMARRMLRDPGLAEEATQDTFVDVLTGAARLERVEALGGWIRTIAVNQCLMRLRSPWHRRRDEMVDDEPTDDASPGRAIDIDQALGRLSGNARMVVWLHCIEGYTHEEIASAFGRSPSFSKSQLARAYRMLAEHCHAAGDGGEGVLAGEPERGTEDERSRAACAF